ncbi:Alpha/Beta hydrolase protein [Collybia nuda]|uniref:Alpha/Beta hydrolase protein n=1 Tax=Collybia nuda TaxID=64659 RepID=A0A9P5Y569_9AGAR|nr:Alpha/Beta hydrolase protein [Collybia nuda]
MPASRSRPYADATIGEKVSAITALLFHMPFVLAWTLLTSPFHINNAHKTWRRVLSDKFLYFLTVNLSTIQLQWLNGDSLYVFKNWTKQNGMSALTDDIDENTRLLWIGRPRTDRVILYLHGGGFVLPMTDFGLSFWKRTIAELKDRGVDTGFAIVNYTLVPTAVFPTPLKQAALALNYLISSGVKPENIQIVGDSAGGNLAIQLISHLLHPLNGIPPVKLSAPIRGFYLMSPWTSLSSKGGSLVVNDPNDTTNYRSLAEWGRQVLKGIPDSQRPYIEAIKAPKAWFKDAKKVTDRVLITGGDAECLWDDIVLFADQFCKNHDEAKFVVQKHGVHNDPFFDFLAGETKLGMLTPIIWEWLTDGFKRS